MLVNRDSAVPLGTPPRYTIAVNEDHSNMVKFGEDDHNYKAVITFISNLCRNMNSQISDSNTTICPPASQTSPLYTHEPNTNRFLGSNTLESARKRVGNVSTIPFSRDLNFVGREDILAQLQFEFADPIAQNWASLYGLGGIGYKMAS